MVEEKGFVVDMRESTTRVSRAQTARGQQKDSVGPERREGKSVEQEGRDREEEKGTKGTKRMHRNQEAKGTCSQNG